MIRSQSAMEYLMTYGWAILAIAIVMVSLYSLGIFNTGSLQPTATPGSCEVVRTAAQTSLAGQCSNLIPKYVAQFNGKNSYVNTSLMNQQSSWTLTAWFKARQLAPQYNGGDMASLLIDSDDPGSYGTGMGANASKLTLIYNNNWGSFTYAFNTGSWYHVVVVFNRQSSTITGYVDGQAVGTPLSVSFVSSPYRTFYMGGKVPGSGTDAYNLSGTISNVQIYNTSLDNTTIKALYQEGIGGAPVDLQHLAGWWPLNGDTNDYSGNNNQATSVNVSWNANWQSGYTSPTT